MLEITSHRNGELLNSRAGRETSAGLEITINGMADPQSSVKINGIPAEKHDRMFSGRLLLTEKINKVTVSSHDKFGDRTQTITLVWDKASFMRYATRIDDNIFFFTDLARERPARIMDHFYLAGLKKLHDKYGTKFILKCFYKNDHDKDGFVLKDMPDIYKSQFEDNSDWLHLAFHALGEFPDRPYQHSTAERLAGDFDLTTSELKRIAGDKCCTSPTNVHWAMLPPSLFHVMRERGVKILTSSGFMSNRIIVDGKIEDINGAACDIGFFYEQDVAQHMLDRRCYYDPDHDLFLSRTFFCFNIDTPAEIEVKIRKEDQDANGTDMLEIIGHEQYAYPSYFNFLPDYFERIETGIRVADELGYKPVFFNDGIFGNTAWD